MSGYKQEYLSIKYDYDNNCIMTDDRLNTLISTLDEKVKAYQKSSPAQPNLSLIRDISDAFFPIGQHYADLLSIKQRLNEFLDGASDEVVDGQDRLVNEERYAERVHPENTVKPREIFFGLMSQLRPSTIPVVLSAGVFMACVSLLMIFQMSGFTGQINIPPALSSLPDQVKHGIGPEPAHKNPVILGGAVVLLGVAVVALTVLYFRSTQMSK